MASRLNSDVNRFPIQELSHKTWASKCFVCKLWNPGNFPFDIGWINKLHEIPEIQEMLSNSDSLVTKEKERKKAKKKQLDRYHKLQVSITWQRKLPNSRKNCHEQSPASTYKSILSSFLFSQKTRKKFSPSCLFRFEINFHFPRPDRAEIPKRKYISGEIAYILLDRFYFPNTFPPALPNASPPLEKSANNRSGKCLYTRIPINKRELEFKRGGHPDRRGEEGNFPIHVLRYCFCATGGELTNVRKRENSKKKNPFPLSELRVLFLLFSVFSPFQFPPIE